MELKINKLPIKSNLPRPKIITQLAQDEGIHFRVTPKVLVTAIIFSWQTFCLCLVVILSDVGRF